MKGNKNHEFIPWLIVVLVAIAASAFFGFGVGRYVAAHAGDPTYAPQGQLTAGFPSGLILDQAAQLNNSYVVNYGAATNEYTAQWSSSSTMIALYTAYLNYFSGNGWTVINNVASYPTLRTISASNGSENVTVAISVDGNGSQVTITYTQ